MTNEKPDLSWIAHYRTEQPNFGLERMDTLLALRGNPHKKISIIHIAGTNGKGSTIATLREDYESEPLPLRILFLIMSKLLSMVKLFQLKI